MSDYLTRVQYKEIPKPTVEAAPYPIDLSDSTMQQHKEKILDRMKEKNIDVMVIYADREHGTNFGFLTGFEPRFEEAVIVLHSDGKAKILLGNESLRMQQYSRLEVEAIHVPHFSLPNQPMETEKTLESLFKDAGISSGLNIGIVGWKLFTSALEDNKYLFDIPYFILEAIKKAAGSEESIINATPLFIDPKEGARIQMNAEEIAHYEFGASLASSRILHVLDEVEEGKTEMELASHLSGFGQPNNVQTICATGDRFTNAVVAPRYKQVEIGDKFSTTLGFRGGLTNRSAYVVSSKDQLPEGVEDYLEAMAKPYFAALSAWYEHLSIGKKGKDIYNLINQVIPKKEYGWKLNPGHLTAGEEWLSSPIFPDSDIEIKSGMLFQCDIIINKNGYGGVNAEDGVAIADEQLRKELENKFPEVWKRIEQRRSYMINTLGINLPPEVLPLSVINGYYRPYLLNKTHALCLN